MQRTLLLGYRATVGENAGMNNQQDSYSKDTTIFRECPKCGKYQHLIRDCKAHLITCSHCNTEFKWTPANPIEWMQKHYGIRPTR